MTHYYKRICFFEGLNEPALFVCTQCAIDVWLCRRLLEWEIRNISEIWWDEIVSTEQTSTMSVMQITSEPPGHCSHALSGKRIKCYMTPPAEMAQHLLCDSLPGEILDVLPSGQWETPILLKEYFKVFSFAPSTGLLSKSWSTWSEPRN